MTPKEHYDNYLSHIYSWMVGDKDVAVSTHRDFFLRHNVRPVLDGVALDLGAGTGIQSFALATLGFTVMAVDFSRSLLAELDKSKGELPITSTESDILTFVQEYNRRAELIICMGDTLTHLRDKAEVVSFIQTISRILVDGGKIIFSYRDLSEEKKGRERFIHVRSDDSRSFTCFLEYFSGRVMVHDIIIEKDGASWTQKIGMYPKLRLAADVVSDILAQNDLTILSLESIRGMTFIVAKKTSPM